MYNLPSKKVQDFTGKTTTLPKSVKTANVWLAGFINTFTCKLLVKQIKRYYSSNGLRQLKTHGCTLCNPMDKKKKYD